MNVALIDDQVGFQVARVADLAERLCRGLSHWPTVSLWGEPTTWPSRWLIKVSLPSCSVILASHRLELLGELLVLLGLGSIFPFGALAIPQGLVEVDVLVLMYAATVLLAFRGWTAWPGPCLS